MSVPEARPVYRITVAAHLADLHPQTLRHYDRAGLVVPWRSPGGVRLYSDRDVRALRLLASLTALGASLDAVRAMIAMASEVSALLGPAGPPGRLEHGGDTWQAT